MNLGILEILKKINFSNIISNTNKTLNVIKKSIPVYKQVKPYVTREKTLFQLNNNKNNIKESKPIKDEDHYIKYNDTLTFFK